MNPILKKMLGREKPVSPEFSYHDSGLKEPTDEWFKIGLANKEKGIPLKASIQQAMLVEDKTELDIRSKYYWPMHELSEKMKYKLKELTEIKENYPEYVESEKKILLDKYYEKIDLLEAKLRKLEAQAEEQDEILSQLNDEGHEA